MQEWQQDVAIGTTPIVQAAKERSIPALYFTNLISARPLMGPAGAGSLATVINAAMGNKARFDQMREFFGSAGAGHSAGVWESANGVPQDRPEFKAETRRLLEKQAKKRKAEAMI
jgi:chlorophyllide a reductase subunit Y